MTKTLIIVPAYNEEGSLKKVVGEIRACASDCEVLVVNDHSSDNTLAIAKNIGVRVLSHPVNLGVGAAIQTGLKYALVNNYLIAVIVDGDGQHDPKEIPYLIKALGHGSADVVIGSRFLAKNTFKTHWARRLGIGLFSCIIRLISGHRITDTTSGYRAFNSRTIKYLADDIPMDFPDANMILSLLFAGYKIIEIPVNMRPRESGQSMYSTLRSIYYPFNIIVAIIAVLLRTIITHKRREICTPKD